jgi:hypothetical protein
MEHNTPYFFRVVPKLSGGWERNTCRKAGFVLDAMEQFPNRTLILLDVDCVVTGDLGKLVGLPCDVALDAITTQKKRRINTVVQTGHMVLNPTPKTQEWMQAWFKTSRNPDFGFNDQDTLALALNGITEISIMPIGNTAKGTVKHDCASRAHGVRKVNGRDRFKNRVLSALGLTWSESQTV